MINTERLKIAPIDMKHLEEIFKLWSDVDVIKYTNVKLMKNIEECREKVLFRINKQTDKDLQNQFVVLLDNKLIGLAGLPFMNKEKMEFSLYYQIGKEYWNKGFGFEVAEALVKYLLKEYPNATIFAGAVVENIGSTKILEKLGFKEISFQKGGFRGFDVKHYKL